MRDIVLVLFFTGALVYGLRHAWACVLLWTLFSIMNPHRLTYGFAHDLPFAAMTAAATLMALIWDRKNVRIVSDAAVIMMLLLMAWMCITTYNALYVDSALDKLDRTLKIFLMTLVAIAVLRDRKHIELFIWVNVLALGFFGVKGGLFTLATGGSYRVWGPPGSFIEDNNALGLALIMMIPLANYLRVVSPSRWVRRGLVATMLLSATAALGTQSRGAFLALSCMVFVLWLRSQRKVVFASALIPIAVLLVAFMPKSWEDRMRTIQSYQQDDSATGRLNAWTTAYNVANDRITGGGFDLDRRETFERYAPDPTRPLTAHSIYFQALGEHGWIGLGIWMSLGALTVLAAARIRRHTLAREEAKWLYELGGMIQVSVVAYAVGGAFLSLAYFDLPYNAMVIAVAAKHWLLQERWRDDHVGAFGAGVPGAGERKTAA